MTGESNNEMLKIIHPVNNHLFLIIPLTIIKKGNNITGIAESLMEIAIIEKKAAKKSKLSFDSRRFCIVKK
jgi:hypothetical protein